MSEKEGNVNLGSDDQKRLKKSGVFGMDAIHPVDRRQTNSVKPNVYYHPENDVLIKIPEVKKDFVFKWSNFSGVKYFFGVVLLIMVAILGFLITVGARDLNNKLDALKIFKNGKYLVLFQNNAELRATGGFIGSFAVVTFNDYKVTNINFNTNIYKIDNDYSENHVVVPPVPVQKIASRWGMRDSNFAVDFPESAKMTEWFYTEETGEKVDGVIGINASIVRDLLKITGPVEISNYQTVVSYDNFFTEISQKVEKDYFVDQSNWKVNEPKSILKDLMPLVFEKAKEASKIKLVNLVNQSLQEKQILFYAEDANIEQSIVKQDWGGIVKSYDGDYLYVNQTNLGGGKSSINVKEKIDYSVSEDGGELIGSLVLNRFHSGSNVWPDGLNVNWTRVLVPRGAVLKFAQIEDVDILKNVVISEEAGKTVFGFWLETQPQTNSMVKLKYTLPISNKKDYQLLVQKQPGNLGFDLTVTVSDKKIFQGILNQDKEIKFK